MSTKVTRRLLMATLIGAAALLPALPALAAPVTLFTADDFYIPRPAAVSDQVGVRRLLMTFDVAANGFGDLIGAECRFTVTANNGDSVHVDNYAVLATNGTETDVYGTESEPNVVTTRLEDETLVLGPVIELYNVMLADPDGMVGTSVEFTVTIDCEIAPTQTTTTTTTAPGATTTTTTPAEATTTTPAEATTTTTVDPPAPPSTVLGTTTTTIGATTSTNVPPVSGGTLPFTGPPVGAASLGLAATALLMLGSGVLVAVRRR